MGFLSCFASSGASQADVDDKFAKLVAAELPGQQPNGVVQGEATGGNMGS
jgi:hypothetical protein